MPGETPTYKFKYALAADETKAFPAEVSEPAAKQIEKVLEEHFLTIHTVAVDTAAKTGELLNVSGVHTITLPAATANAIVGVYFANGGKVTTSGGAFIFGDFVHELATITFAADQHATLVAEGTNWRIVAGEPKREEAQKPKLLTSGKAEEFSATRPVIVRVQAKAGESITTLLQHTEGLATAPPVGAVVTLFVQPGETITVSTSGGLAANAWYFLL